MNTYQAIPLAITNVAAFGDTDIFPSPLDRFACQDLPGEVSDLLKKIDSEFENYLAGHPPQNISALVPLGYTAFRWATQIDSVWNIYYLSLVISMADAIEAKRIGVSENSVFSYRFAPAQNSGHLFADSTWRHYKQEAIKASKDYGYVLVADIADFYARVAHHRLENELQRLNGSVERVRRIVKLIQYFSQTRSYGLPIGGPASRILAELALNPVDLYLHRKGIRFCRYVDDFHIFAESKQEAYSYLAFLAQILFNEGLSLQRNKTRILTSEELRQESRHLDFAEIDDVTALPPEARLMRLSVRYDPYSPTAEEDYETLKEAVSSIDIVGILSREIAKTNIDAPLTKQAIAAVRALDSEHRSGAIITLLDIDNLETLAPVFGNVMRLLRSVYDEVDESTQNFADQTMIQLFDTDSYLIRNELNLAFLLPVFGLRQSIHKEKVLVEAFDRSLSPLVRKEIILIMARWGVTYWLSDILRRFDSLSRWERKSLIIASYHLHDEGRHWREHAKSMFSADETIVRNWYANRINQTREVPI